MSANENIWGSTNNRMKRHLVILLTFALAALVFLVYPQQFSDNGAVIGQKRAPRRAAGPPAARPAAIDYSKFSHATKKHQEACNTCHKVPTSNWRKVGDYPDVADYPDHDSCLSCHRRQFFKGPKPAICSVCHSKVSPRDEVRFAFRNPARRRQFLIEFPHDKHQDVIAKLFRGSPVEERPRFVHASFALSNFNADDKTKHYNNCEICHGPRPAPSVAPASGWVDGFVPDNLTLKAVPASHASCFSCHWKSEQPLSDNCAGCHKLPTAAAMIPAVDSRPKRISMKFRHDGGGEGDKKNHPAECTVCHINITKASTLRGLEPDVPIFPSCADSSCHKNVLTEELVKYNKAPGTFSCVKCHTSDVGSKKPPNSHTQAAAGQ